MYIVIGLQGQAFGPPLVIWSRRRRKAYLYSTLTQERFFKETSLQQVLRPFHGWHQPDILKESMTIEIGLKPSKEALPASNFKGNIL